MASGMARTVARMADGARAGRNSKREDSKGGAVIRLPEGSAVAVAERPDQAVHQYTQEDIDRALWEIALHGGNVSRAFNSLEDQGFVGYVRRTMSYWKNGPYRNRYHELLQGRARDYEEHLAQKALEIAARQQRVQEEALDQVAGRLGSLDAVEASTVIRNIAGAQAQGIDKALALRGRHPAQSAGRGLEAIASALARLGVVELEEGDVEEAHVVSDSA